MVNGIFPSLLEILVPNFFNIYTWIGVAIIVIGVLGLVALGNPITKAFFSLFTDNPNAARRLALVLIFVGAAVVWGISFIADLMETQEGVVIFWGSVLTIFVWVITRPKKRTALF